MTEKQDDTWQPLGAVLTKIVADIEKKRQQPQDNARQPKQKIA